MLYIPKIDDYLEIVTDEEVKNFVVKTFTENIRKKENLITDAKSLYIFLITPNNYVHHYHPKILNLFDPGLQLINTKPVIKSKLKELLSQLKSSILVLGFKKKK